MRKLKNFILTKNLNLALKGGQHSASDRFNNTTHFQQLEKPLNATNTQH